MRIGAACTLDDEKHFPAPGSCQDCPTELYFEAEHSINKIKFSGTVVIYRWRFYIEHTFLR